MKPQFHPSADDITVESILHALSDPARVQIFAAIARSECAQTCAAFLEFERSQGVEVYALWPFQDPSRGGPHKE
jgi:DNA-binding transcriptional ArsR family regulator